MTTVKTDVAAISPTANAKAVVQARGADISGLMTLLQTHAIEMQILAKTIISLHPGGDSVLSAAVNAAGSGGTNGAVTINGTTGTGTRFQARGTISGGALSGPLTIANAGLYSIDPTSLAAEPVTGGNLTGATVALTMAGDLAALAALNAVLAELL